MKPFIPAWLDDAGLTPHQHRVLCTLWRRGEGKCYPSMANIAKTCRMKRDTVCKVLRELEEGGWIIRRKRKGKGVRNGNQYDLLVPPVEKMPRLRRSLNAPNEEASKRPVSGGKKGYPLEGITIEGDAGAPAVTESASGECDLQSPSTNAVFTPFARLSFSEARLAAIEIRNEEIRMDPYGLFAMYPEGEFAGWGEDWYFKAEATGWLIGDQLIRNARAALHGYLRKIVKHRSKKFKELRDSHSDDEEPPF